jgi:outer membrane receptor protein involved in Fe transport
MKHLGYIMILLFAVAANGVAQERPDGSAKQDTVPAFSTDAIVVTADRTQNRLANSTSSVSVMSADEIRSLPISKFADAAQYIPGLYTINMDGMGRNSVISSRGFYGGGEAEYLLVMLDGIPLNDLETGLVNWNLVPVNSISSIELSRGASSPLYGDVALGGVMNIITRNQGSPLSTISIDGGSYGNYDGHFFNRGSLSGNPYNIYFSNEHSDGYRDHSGWLGTNLNGEIGFRLDEQQSLNLSTANEWTHFDDPGVLTSSEVDLNRAESDPLYKGDGQIENRHSFNALYKNQLTDASQFTVLAAYANRSANTTTTYGIPATILPYYASDDYFFYGDTKERVLQDNEGNLSLQYVLNGDLGSGLKDKLTIGADGTLGKIDSKYDSVYAGFESQYENAFLSPGATVIDGQGDRKKYAAYAYLEQHVTPEWLFTFGGREDGIRDSYTGTLPSDTTLSAKSSAFSWKVGSNYTYMQNEIGSGNLYATVNRSFKAPTLDQLTDQRYLNVAFFTSYYGGKEYSDPTGNYSFVPYQAAPFSSALLIPQTGTTYESGLYQRFKWSDAFYSEHTLSVYRMDMKNEIDFNLTTFSYDNVQQSRHFGIEEGSKFYFLPGVTAFLNYTLNSVKYTSGPDNGNQFKAIPLNVFAVGASYEYQHTVRLNLDWNIMNDTYLDDANSAHLNNIQYANMRVSYLISRYTIFADAQNLFNSQYNSTGYILYGETFLYPAAGRVLRGGLSVDL